MAYTDDSVRAKLASLNETQESVVSVAQWIMFHRRHADRTANLWLARLQEVSTSKRLNLIYLANEVVQQSRARSKQDFLLAFEPIIGEATALAYKSADGNTRGKVRRVVEVWKDRKIFDKSIQDGIEAQLDAVDKDSGSGSRSTLGGAAKPKSGKLGGGLFSGSSGVPSELESSSAIISTLNEMQDGMKSKVSKANEDFVKMTDPNNPVPTPPVHAARLSALGKTLATAQGAVEASLKARTDLIAQLEKLVQSQRERLQSDEATFAELQGKREGVEAKKNDVEDGIMRGLSTPSSPDIPTPTNTSNSAFATGLNGNADRDSADERRELDRPEAEDFTPPPPDRDIISPVAEAMTPEEGPMDPRTRRARNSFTSTTGAESIHEHPPNFNEPPPTHEPPPALPVDPSNAAAAAEQFLSSLTASGVGQVRQASTEIPNGSSDPRLKRRKLSHQSPVRREEEFATSIDAGVDEEGISALLQ
jgi:regulator of Ty1 transposition protein 103